MYFKNIIFKKYYFNEINFNKYYLNIKKLTLNKNYLQ